MTVATFPQLRPLGLGELLDRTMRLYRRNFLTFIGIIAIVQVPLTLIQLLLSLLTFGEFVQYQNPNVPPPSDLSQMFGPAFLGGLGGSVVLGIVSFVLFQGVATAALTRAIADSYLGQRADILGSYRRIGRSWVRLILALLLAMIIGLLLTIWFLVPCIGWLTGIGMLAFFSAVIIPLIAPTIVLEGQTASQAWRRAWDLARRRFWWVIGFVAILYLFAQLIVSGPTALVGILFPILADEQMVVDNPTAFFTLQTVVQSLVGLVFSLLYLPVQLVGITLMYFDLRVRAEGFDLALLAVSASGDEAEVAQLTAQAPSPRRGARLGDLITRRELAYFALLSMLAVVGIGLFMALFAALGVAFVAAAGGI